MASLMAPRLGCGGLRPGTVRSGCAPMVVASRACGNAGLRCTTGAIGPSTLTVSSPATRSAASSSGAPARACSSHGATCGTPGRQVSWLVHRGRLHACMVRENQLTDAKMPTCLHMHTARGGVVLPARQRWPHKAPCMESDRHAPHAYPMRTAMRTPWHRASSRAPRRAGTTRTRLCPPLEGSSLTRLRLRCRVPQAMRCRWARAGGMHAAALVQAGMGARPHARLSTALAF